MIYRTVLMAAHATRGNIREGGSATRTADPALPTMLFYHRPLEFHKIRCAALFAHSFALFSSLRGLHNCVEQSRMLRLLCVHTSSCEVDPTYHLDQFRFWRFLARRGMQRVQGASVDHL